MNNATDRPLRSTIDRRIGWLIALGGCIVLLDQTVFRLSELPDWALWWNVGAFAVITGLLVLAIGGLLLPMRALITAWWTLPILYIVLQATWIWGYQGSELDDATPWLWSVEPPIITILVLVMRPAAAIVGALLISAVPALSSLMIVGTVSTGLMRQTAIELGSVIYVVIFIGVRIHLTQLHTLEDEAHSQRRREIRATAAAEEHAKLSRVVHDEVLSVLASAMHVEGPPTEAVQRAAHRALVVLDQSIDIDTAEVSPVPVSLREAAVSITGKLRTIDETFTLKTHLSDGIMPSDVAEGVSLAAAEALRNSVRHGGGQASRWVWLALSPERVRVTIKDDGVGFELQHTPLGLGVTESIVRRMSDLGGTATVRSQPGQGTEVVLSWPT